MIYLIKFSLFLLVLYGFYKLVLVRTNHFQANRYILLVGLLLALVYPLIEIPQNEVMIYSLPVQEVIHDMSNTTFEVSPTEIESDRQMVWADYLVYIWLFGAILFAFTFVITLINWKVQLGKAKQQFFKGVKVYFGRQCEPSSFFGSILMPDEIMDDEQSYDYILAHEMAHVKLGHSWDRTFLAIVKVVFWWNPLVWLIEKELCLIHEYSADQMALAQPNSSKHDYAKVLLAKTMGLNSNQLLIPSFYQSPLKKRFKMLSKFVKSSKPYLYLFIVPVLFFLAYGCQEEELFNEDLKFVAKDKWLSMPEGPGDEICKVVESMPEFPGDCDEGLSLKDAKKCADGALLEYLGNNVVYPEAAVEKGTQGNAVVSFVVEKDGTLSDIRLIRDVADGCGEEALRVIEKMQKETIWKPGIQKGKRVRTKFNLPIRFKLDGEKSSNAHLSNMQRLSTSKSLIEILSKSIAAIKGNKDIDKIPAFKSSCNASTDEEQFICSHKAIDQFFSENLDFTRINAQKGDKGTWFIGFEVLKNGNLNEIKVLGSNSQNEIERNEIKRVANMMRKNHWIPAQSNNESVDLSYFHILEASVLEGK